MLLKLERQRVHFHSRKYSPPQAARKSVLQTLHTPGLPNNTGQAQNSSPPCRADTADHDVHWCYQVFRQFRPLLPWQWFWIINSNKPYNMILSDEILHDTTLICIVFWSKYSKWYVSLSHTQVGDTSNGTKNCSCLYWFKMHINQVFISITFSHFLKLTYFQQRRSLPYSAFPS